MNLLLPEHRQLELYSHKRSLPIADDEAQAQAQACARMRALAESCERLAEHLGVAESVADPMAMWRAYQAAPRDGLRDKILAECLRALRICHIASRHAAGRVESRNGLIKASATVEHTGLSLRISVVGADLLGSLVAVALAEASGPYPVAYVESLLASYYADANAEIRWFNDEDRVLYQFAPPIVLNRHLRYDCDNAKYEVRDGVLRIVLSELYRDANRFPIDFYIIHDGALHIIPVECLRAAAIPVSQLPRWRARLDGAGALPAAYRARFTREEMKAGLPMT